MRRLTLLVMLIAAVARGEDLRVDSIRHSLLGTHTRYQQYIGGLPVIGGERIEGPHGTRDALARRGFAHAEAAVMRAHGDDLVYVNVGGVARLAVREITGGNKPVATIFDAASGERLLEMRLWFDAAGRVFSVNPVAKLNDPSLRDSLPVPDAAYSVVELPDLAATGALAGPNVRIVDTDAPFTARAEASQSLLFDRGQPQFEEVSAYFHIDRSQRYLQSLGFNGAKRIAAYAIPVDPHAVNGSDNSFYASGVIRGQGQLFFGDGGTDDAEDSDIMLHEFAHAIHDWIAPDAFNGSSGSEARAIAEGFGDYWAFSQTYEETVRSGRDPYCIGDWDARCFGDAPDQRCSYPAGSDCLRRVDGRKTMADFLRVDSAGFEHENGEIWSSALIEIFMASGRRATDTLVIESLLGTPANTTFSAHANRMLAVDAAMRSGLHDAICRAMTKRGILAVTDCVAPPRGEWTILQSATASIHMDDMRSIDEVLVRVRATGPSKITLVAPGGKSVLLSAAFQGDATFGLNALPAMPLEALSGMSAFGDWKLVVEGGQLREWSLMFRFAGDTPFTTRPLTTQLRKHVPVVGYLTGAANTSFTTDVHIFNRSNFTASLIAVFTPTGTDGTTQFAAVRLSIPPHQVMVLDDIVRNTFQTSGLGQLELLGDTDRIIVTTRVATSGHGGSVPTFNTIDAGMEEIVPLHNTMSFRSNVGVAEVFGNGGVVRFTFFTQLGAILGTTDVAVAPFGHAQVRVPFVGANLRAHVSIVSGDPRVIAYGTITHNLSTDTAIVAARSFPKVPASMATVNVAFASDGVAERWILRPGLSGVSTIAPSDDDLTPPAISFFYDNDWIVQFGSFRGELSSGFIAPAVQSPQAPTKHLVGLQESLATSVYLVNFEAQTADATVLVYDAAGAELQRSTVRVFGKSFSRIELPTGLARRIEVVGAVSAYAVLQDPVTKDLTYISEQY